MKLQAQANGKDIEDPICNALTVIFIYGIFFLTSPLLIPIHYVLYMSGHKGLYQWKNDTYWVIFDRTVFKKR